jgi:hypothetical protein
MQSAPEVAQPETTSRAAQPTPEVALGVRTHQVRAARWLQKLWGHEAALPTFQWGSLAALPRWALSPPEQLERLALLTGALFAAPALRMCLDAGPLMRVRNLIGPQALDHVLTLSDQPIESPQWPQDENSERNTLYSWGAALLASSVADPAVQASLIRAFSLSKALVRNGLPPLELAKRMTTLAIQVTKRLLEDKSAASVPKPESA